MTEPCNYVSSPIQGKGRKQSSNIQLEGHTIGRVVLNVDGIRHYSGSHRSKEFGLQDETTGCPHKAKVQVFPLNWPFLAVTGSSSPSNVKGHRHHFQDARPVFANVITGPVNTFRQWRMLVLVVHKPPGPTRHSEVRSEISQSGGLTADWNFPTIRTNGIPGKNIWLHPTQLHAGPGGRFNLGWEKCGAVGVLYDEIYPLELRKETQSLRKCVFYNK